jgi:hypothetical protein
MQEAGIQGEMVVANYWMEVFNCERFSGPSLTHRFNIWKDADTSLDFNAWLKSAACRQNPKIQELEQSEAQRGGALRIDYLTAKETARYEIHFLNDAHGVYLVRAGQRFLTEHEQTLFRERTGRALFVLTLDQKLYAASQIFGKFHHSSFLRAKPIAAAGELITDKAGRLKGFTFNSGHYRPGKDQLMTFLTFLASRGIDLDQVEVDLSRGTSLKHHLSAALCHRQLLEGLDPFSLPAFIPLPSVLIEAPSDDLAEVTHNPESFPSPPSITAVTLSPNQPFPRFVFELRNALEGAFFTATQEIFPIPVVGSAIESALNADRILGVFISSIASASPATAEILSSPGEVFTSSFSLEADCFEYYKPF